MVAASDAPGSYGMPPRCPGALPGSGHEDTGEGCACCCNAGFSLAWPSSSSALPYAAPEPAPSPIGHRQGLALPRGPGVGALGLATRGGLERRRGLCTFSTFVSEAFSSRAMPSSALWVLSA